MAKGNLFLGTSRNSVGDVVMYRRDGAQVSRVRVRKVANPKTAAQCLQRVFFSPVARFYAPLAITLAKSFEGLSKSKSYSKFLKTNIEKARANGWYLPKGMGFYPLPYKISEGSLRQVNLGFDEDDISITLTAPVAASGTTTIGHMSELFIGLGYTTGDVVTFILIAGDNNNSYWPISVQFEVDTTSVEPLANIPGSFVFEIDADTKKTLSIRERDDLVAGYCCIVSRWENDKWRRSCADLTVMQAIVARVTGDVKKAEAIASYQSANGESSPMVYLDGENA